MDDAWSSLGLGKDDGIRSTGHDCIEVGVGHARVQAVDAYEQAGALFGGACPLEKFNRGSSGRRFALRDDRILQIHNYRVGLARQRLVELGAAIRWDEQERAHVPVLVELFQFTRNTAQVRDFGAGIIDALWGLGSGRYEP